MAEMRAAQAELPTSGGETLRVTLVNNMADAALAITEQRFLRLLQAACPQTRIDFRCVTLPAIPRGEMADARIAKHYITLDELHAAAPDALIFSGAEPAFPSLRHEVFWPGLTDLFDWAKAENIPTLFSCLAAHAAVLHFASIERHRLQQKKFGVFAHARSSNHTLLEGLPPQYWVAHSRWNDVRAEDLRAGGYDVLTHGENAGADMFVPNDGATQIFLQGHPEYEDSALQGEYNRDLRRYENGQSEYKPNPPLKEDWRSSALGGSACMPIDSPQAPNPPVNFKSGFEIVIRNWLHRKKEIVI